MLSIIQLSKFFVAVISDNFYILSPMFCFVNNFFILFFAVSYLSCDSYIRLSPIESFVNNFFHFLFHFRGQGFCHASQKGAPRDKSPVPTTIPTDCSVHCTPAILPNIRISRDKSHFYAHIGASTKAIHLFMSKLIQVYSLSTLVS